MIRFRDEGSTLTSWTAVSCKPGAISRELLRRALCSSRSYWQVRCLVVKVNWGLETCPLLLFWKQSLNLARLSNSLQDSLLKKRDVSLSNSVVNLIGGRCKNRWEAEVCGWRESVAEGGDTDSTISVIRLFCRRTWNWRWLYVITSKGGREKST